MPWHCDGFREFGGVSPLHLSIALAILIASSTDAAATDNNRFCSPTAPNVVLYLDVTTPYDDLDKQTLVNGATQIFESLRGGERLSIRTIADEFSVTAAYRTLCPILRVARNPARSLLRFTEGVVINEKKRMKASIANELRRAMTASGNLPYSEIIRTLSLSANEEFRPDRENDFYIFSDLIENSKYLAGKKFLWEPTELLLAVVRNDGLIPTLTGVSVRVFGVGRGGNPENCDALPQEVLTRVENFWKSYFSEAGATLMVQQNLSLQ